MTVAYGGSAVERACHGWHAPGFQAEQDSVAQKAGLDGNVIRATQLEEIAAKPAKK